MRPEGSRHLIGTVNNSSETEAKVEFLCHAGGLCQAQNELIFGTGPLKARVPLEKQEREEGVNSSASPFTGDVLFINIDCGLY